MLTETTRQQKQTFDKRLSGFIGQYLLTLGFPPEMTRRQAHTHLDQFLSVLNGYVFSRRSSDKHKHLEGFVVTDQPILSSSNQFHLLISAGKHKLPPITRLRRMVEKAVTDSQRRLRSTSTINFTLKDYADRHADDFRRYISRKFRFKSMHWNRSKEKIGLLSHTGVLFGRDRFKDMSLYD